MAFYIPQKFNAMLIDDFLRQERTIARMLVIPTNHDSRIQELFEKYASTYREIHFDLSEKISSLANPAGDISEDLIPTLEQNTEHLSQVESSYRRITDAMSIHRPTIAASETSQPSKDLTAKHMMFYYEGKGDLYLHGSGMKMPDESGILKAIGWDDFIPLTKIADGLWSCTAYLDPGSKAEYKLRCNMGWAVGKNSTLGPSTAMTLIAPAFEHEYNICLPIKVNPENYTFCIFGEGVVLTPSGDRHQLRWDRPLEMQSMGSALWKASFIPEGAVSYKFCLVGPDQKVIWEKGPNREMKLGATLSHVPSFDLPAGVEIKILSIPEIKRERLSRDKLDAELLLAQDSKRATIQGARPVAAMRNGNAFERDEILEIHELKEFRLLDGTLIDNQGQVPADGIIKGRAKDGKWVIFQQGTQGCTAGSSAFLMLDHGVIPRRDVLSGRTGAPMEIVEQDLNAQGLNAIVTLERTVPSADLSALRDLILRNGSAAMRIKFGNHNGIGHAIVVDDISEDLTRVRLRDPWHGWDITVRGGIFLRNWKYSRDPLVLANINVPITQVAPR
jgi:hypothetical protein